MRTFTLIVTIVCTVIDLLMVRSAYLSWHEAANRNNTI